MRSFRGYLVVIVLCALAGCTYRKTPEDAVNRVAHRYGVPRQDVLALAEELGVDPGEIGSFGPYYFPYNYYEHLFESFEREHGRPPKRSEVEQLVRGYVAKCDEGSYMVSYIFYSTRAHKGLGGGIAMVFDVGFQRPKPNETLPPDPEFSWMRPVELWDGSVNPPSETYWDECIQAYLRER
jgi:hypothetical protein